MDTVLLVTISSAQGKYIVFNEKGDVLLGPFFSHPDPSVLAQRLADATRSIVRRPDAEMRVGDEGWRVFWPTPSA